MHMVLGGFVVAIGGRGFRGSCTTLVYMGGAMIFRESKHDLWGCAYHHCVQDTWTTVVMGFWDCV